MERKIGKATIMIAMLLMMALIVILPTVKAIETIYIKADGSIDPLTAPIITVDNITYTLTGDITADADAIVIERDDIVLDGVGYTVQGTGSGNGIMLSGRTNVTIKNMIIKAFDYVDYAGILLDSSSSNSISGNNITNNSNGIGLESSFDNNISGNNITDNGTGIYLIFSSEYNSISGNNITSNGVGITFYLSPDNSISGNNITANNFDGILLDSSSNNSISGNNITASNWEGILLESSSNNSISGNNITGNNGVGIWLYSSSSHNSISGNNIANNNNITSNTVGIAFYLSPDNSISGNNITTNYGVGIYLDSSSDNSIFHNNFIRDFSSLQVYTIDSVNVWDDGYPSGGNYWSDYTGSDEYSGPGQNVVGSDGMGDAAYIIDASNSDRYPLMVPYKRLKGDVNDDRRVNILDAILLSNAFNSKPGDANWNPNADFNGDKKVNILDAIILSNNFGQIWT